jgi:hypothetical protein
MPVQSGVARGTVAALLLPLALAGCGVARSNQIAAMSPDQLAAVSDRDICQGFTFNRSNANILTEVNRRQLGDCAPDHFTCTSWGASFGSSAYVQCRAQLAGAARTSQAISAAAPQPRQPQCVSVASARGSSTTCY